MKEKAALPPELYMYWEAYPWRLGQVFCIIKSYVQELTAYASVLTIAAFTIERYLAICHPMTLQVLNHPSRALRLLIVQWIIAIVCALPFAIYTRTFYLVDHPETAQPIKDSLICNVPHDDRDTMTYFFQISTFVFFVYPMSVILIMYILIGIKLSNTNPVPNDRNNSAVVQARKSVIKMLVAVVVAFFLCWAPFHAQRLMTLYITAEEWTPFLLDVQNNLFLISGVLYFIGSTINPILYNAMSKKYRRAFLKTILPCLRSQANAYTSTFNSNSPASKSSPYFYNKLSTRPATRTSGLQDSSQEDSSPV
ncbi:CAPAR-like protein [Mya arenaria]|uniref:CAPAR-like protein n=1 Tax=Mya arenaria TaxID=6604 RepID=A0ABY7EEZ7_MYAAR|nr:CAPAR-like protein [Mya arenaria]